MLCYIKFIITQKTLPSTTVALMYFSYNFLFNFIFRELTNKDPKSEFGYRLTIQTDPNDTARTLAVFHLPSIGIKESSEVADRAIRSDLLSVERLLVHTVYIRSLSRLSDIKAEFQSFLKDVDCK